MSVAAVDAIKPVNIDSPTDNAGYPNGRLSARAGQEFAAMVFKVETVLAVKLAALAPAKVAR
jgi:hypothetical protein